MRVAHGVSFMHKRRFVYCMLFFVAVAVAVTVTVTLLLMAVAMTVSVTMGMAIPVAVTMTMTGATGCLWSGFLDHCLDITQINTLLINVLKFWVELRINFTSAKRNLNTFEIKLFLGVLLLPGIFNEFP